MAKAPVVQVLTDLAQAIAGRADSSRNDCPIRYIWADDTPETPHINVTVTNRSLLAGCGNRALVGGFEPRGRSSACHAVADAQTDVGQWVAAERRYRREP